MAKRKYTKRSNYWDKFNKGSMRFNSGNNFCSGDSKFWFTSKSKKTKRSW